MSITCKFSKRITLIFEFFNWKAKNWALAFLARLNLVDWELLKAIIFDRDSKFLVEFWRSIFDQLKVKLLYSTTYHSQIDEQSKRTNQTVEIVLRYHLFHMLDIKEWLFTLSTIQTQINNIINAIIEKISNEIVYEFISIQFADIISENTVKMKNSTRVRQQVVDFITWAQASMKHVYDCKNQSLNLKVDDHVLLRLHKEYFISFTKILDRKLSQQYIESFRILDKIENLFYRLNLSQHWKIHLIVFVTQIESISNSALNSFRRSRLIESEFVQIEDDIDTVKFFEIERLINKRITTRDVKYLLRWKDYDSQWNEWRNLDELHHALNLIQNYEKIMNNVVVLSDRLSRRNFLTNTLSSSTLNEQFSKSSFKIITSKSLSTSSFDMSTTNSIINKTINTRRSTRKRITSWERDDII
jgi:hypothetical protein